MTYKELVSKATEAANLAGKAWMDKATVQFVVQEGDIFGNPKPGAKQYGMLDLCGNAHVQFKDRRSAPYKAFVRDGLVRSTGNAVVEIDHAYRYNQEHGLKIACAEAAKAVLEEGGVSGLRIWSYID